MFKDKTVLVTASSTGIGLAIVKDLGLQGANIVVTSRKEKNVQESVQELKSLGVTQVLGFPCDSSSQEDQQKLINFTIEHFKNIDILVPNLAVSTHFGSLMDISVKQMQKMVNTNLISTLTLIQTAKPHMKEGGYELDAAPIAFYSITKTALLALTKVLSKELKEYNVNCVAPGLIKTKFSEQLWKGKEEETIDLLGLNRLGETKDISNAVTYLAQADYVTGETLVVAGKPMARL